jgi:hypothetical protein
MKTKGSIETFDLGAITGELALSGLVLGIRHEGPGLVRRWGMEQQRWRMNEVRRLRALIALEGEDLVRELFADQLKGMEANRLERLADLEHDGLPIPDELREPLPLNRAILTPEGQDELIAMQKRILAQVVASLGDLTDPAMIVDELDRLGALVPAFLRAQEVQRLMPAQFPATQGAGHHGPAASPAAGT